jgi:hypothetical protein
MPMSETQRDLYEASRHWNTLAETIRETGVVRPEDVAEIAQALAFLHSYLGFQRRHASEED